MNSEYFQILDHLSVGIVIADMDFQIVFLNQRAKEFTKKGDQIIGKNLIEEIPSLDRGYLKKALEDIKDKGNIYFFSSTMHKNLISDELNINLKISKIENNDSKYLIFECSDVTNQIVRINQLKDHSKELQKLNRILKQQEEEITRLAYYDELTGLANRLLFYNIGEKMLQDSIRNNKIMGIMFIDIDKFKSINDTYGHAVGDKVLKRVGEVLEATIRQNDIAARHGGDEFLVLLTDCKEYCNYETIAKRIEESSKKITIDNELEVEISLSIGVSFYPIDGESLDQLISKADKAMYKVKNQGGNKCRQYKM